MSKTNLCSLVLLTAVALPGQSEQLPLITRASNDVGTNGPSFNPSTSDDGRYVAFESFATQFGVPDTNGRADIYRWDRWSNTYAIVSRPDGSATLQALGGDSRRPSISPDGRFVAFESRASNLPGANGGTQIYVRDLVTNRTILVSRSTANPALGGNNHSGRPEIAVRPGSELGAGFSGEIIVAFESGASDLIANDNNATVDVFIRRVVAGVTERINRTHNGSMPQGASTPSISRGVLPKAPTVFGTSVGRYVAYHSNDPQIVPGGTTTTDVYVFDRLTNQTVLASVGMNGAAGNGASWLASISYAADDMFTTTPFQGVKVAFASTASNLVPNDIALNYQDVFVRDLGASNTTRVSVNVVGMSPNGDSSFPSIDHDGDRVSFESLATDLTQTPGFQQGSQVFVASIGSTVQVELVSIATTGNNANAPSQRPSISGDGVVISFESSATDLTAVPSGSLNDIHAADMRNPGSVPYGYDSGATGFAELVPTNNPVIGSTFRMDCHMLLQGATNPVALLVVSPVRHPAPVNIGSTAQPLDLWVDNTSASFYPVAATALGTVQLSYPIPATTAPGARAYFQYYLAEGSLQILSNAIAAVANH